MDTLVQEKIESLTLPVTGMTCAGCAGRVQKAAAGLPGVDFADINLALETLDVRFNASAVNAGRIAEAVRTAGYGVRTAKVTLAISGMTCAGCARRVEKALTAAHGVLDAEVNLALETASVAYVPGVADPRSIAQAATDAGYPATLKGETGVDLEAAEAAARRRDLTELAAAALLSLPLAAQMLFMLANGIALPAWLQLALATPVQFWIGRRFYLAAWHGLRARAGNMDQLVVLGTSAAYFYSLWQVLAGGTAGGHLYFEASAVVITLILTGKVLEARAKRSASAALRQLMDLRPETAVLLRAGQEVSVPVAEVLIDDVVILKPGEQVPVDGMILRGESELDESLLTGEPMPVVRKPGDMVIAGTVNGSGLLRVRARRVGHETTLAKIARLVEAAQRGKAPIQRLVDRIAAVFVPVVMVIAALTMAAWLFTGHAFEPSLTAAISVLVIACPCALGLATPTALVAGTGAAAKGGVLIRDIETLERARQVDTVVFDKTGTLTVGKPEVVEVVPFEGDADSLLTLAGSAQAGSEHPLGQSVVRAAKAAKLALTAPSEFRAKVGAGIEARTDAGLIRIGRADFAAAGATPEQTAQADRISARGETVVWVSRDDAVVGLIGIADQPRPEAAAAVAALKLRGLRVVLLTGDNADAAQKIGAAVGIEDVRAGMRPEDKVAALREMVGQGRKVAMVGDGINDAPALALADLGIAMGSGADVALETAGFILMRPNPLLVGSALEISEATSRKIRQNLFWAFGYNVVCIPVAALGLLNPAVAGAAMAFSSVSVVTNSLLLRRWRPASARRPQETQP